MEDRKTGTSGLLKDWAGMIARTANASFFKAIMARANGDVPGQSEAAQRRLEEEQDFLDSPSVPIGPEIPTYVPLDHMLGHAPTIRTLTQDGGSFTMNFERHEAVPYALSEELALSAIEGAVAARKKKEEAKS